MSKMTGSDIKSFLKATGYGKSVDDVSEIIIRPFRVDVVAYLRNTSGNLYIDPETEDAATETYSIMVNWDE